MILLRHEITQKAVVEYSVSSHKSLKKLVFPGWNLLILRYMVGKCN